MLSTLTALAAVVFLSASLPGDKAGGEVQAAPTSCHCPCCKGGVCKCRMKMNHAPATGEVNDLSKAVALFSRYSPSCNCRDGQPLPQSRSADILTPGSGPRTDLHLAPVEAAFFQWTRNNQAVLPLVTGVFDPSPPGSFRTTPLRI
jgi:hypothetical protein